MGSLFAAPFYSGGNHPRYEILSQFSSLQMLNKPCRTQGLWALDPSQLRGARPTLTNGEQLERSAQRTRTDSQLLRAAQTHRSAARGQAMAAADAPLTFSIYSP